MIDPHSIEKGTTVCAFVGGVPTEVIYQGLMPYNGFYSGKTWEERIEVPESAIFSDTKNGLINDKINSLRDKIALLENSIERLQEML